MLFPHDQGGWTLELPAVAWWALDLPGFSNYLLVLMTRLVLNLHTTYSDVGGTVGDLRTGEKKKNFRRPRQIFAILFFLRRLSLR